MKILKLHVMSILVFMFIFCVSLTMLIPKPSSVVTKVPTTRPNQLTQPSQETKFTQVPTHVKVIKQKEGSLEMIFEPLPLWEQEYKAPAPWQVVRQKLAEPTPLEELEFD